MHISASPTRLTTTRSVSQNQYRHFDQWAKALSLMVASVFVVAPTFADAKPMDFKVSGPHLNDNLAVYFIHGKSQPGPVPLTLAEALRNNNVTVHETGRVQQLLIENTGDREVFVQAGDIVKGGRQDRVLTISLLLPPKSGKIKIGSYCVEQGRWSKRGSESVKRFTSAESAMPSKAAKIAMLSVKQRPVTARVPRSRPPLTRRGDLRHHRRGEQRTLDRQGLVQSRGAPSRQQEVWRNVAEIQRKLSANVAAGIRSKASASSLQLSLENQKLIKARKKMTRQLLPLGASDGDIIGYAFAINGQINSAEIYPSNGLFRKMWPKLIQSSVTEAIAEKTSAGTTRHTPDQAAIEAFLDEGMKGKVQTSKLRTTKLKRERRESKRGLSLATRRADGRYVHQSVLAY